MNLLPACLTFLGATGTVTGSRFLLQHAGRQVLVDCGLFQGLRELRRRNWRPFAPDPAAIDAVVLTHAHLDHCGYLPALVRDGFRGRVVCTPGTARLAAIVLRDSAHLQEEDAADARRGGYSRHAEPQPLYTSGDAEKAIALLDPVPFDSWGEVVPRFGLQLRRAGHILGAASALVQAGPSTVLVSGDLGRPQHPLLLPPEPPPAADVVVVESTYGDRGHAPGGSDELADAVVRTVHRGGTVLIPAFAVDRTEVVLVELRRLMRAGRVPTVPVYVDSPMALDTLEVYRRAGAAASPELVPGLMAGGDPFDTGDLHEARSVEESKRLNSPRFPCIVISASGMASGGRVLHHLASLLPDPRNTVVLVGFQAAGTRGRDLAQGARAIKIHGRYVPVRAEVVDLLDHSAHADADEVLGWLSQSPATPRTCFVVHGEPEASAVLAARISEELGWCAVVPRDGEKVRVD